MKILFVHQNFPGQFPRLSKLLSERGHQVLALTAASNNRSSPVQIARYKEPDTASIPPGVGRRYTEHAERGLRVARAARVLRDEHGFRPDVIVGHSGWGETLFLKEVWPQTRLIAYSELMFSAEGQDVGFDPEFPIRDPLSNAISVQARQAHLIQAFVAADQVITPTRFQADSHPPMLRDQLRILHDGIDTDRVCPDPNARFILPDGRGLNAGDEVITFVSRALEPYRGFHIFMRALPGLLDARPEAQVLIVGAEGQSYGPPPADGGSWKARALAELDGRLDVSRVHFLNRIPYADYIRLLQVSRAHVYLTYPFVLSWSALEAMSAGCQIIASDTAPVREVMTDGISARLVDFFDVPGLSRAMTDALAMPGVATAMRQAAREFVVTHYGLQTCLQKLVALVEQG